MFASLPLLVVALATAAPVQSTPAPTAVVQAAPALSAPAQTAPVPAAPGGTLQLTLEQAVETALANDLSLRIEEISGEIARYTYEGSWGSFDPLLRAQASFQDSKQEINQPYIPVPSIDTQTLNLSGGVYYPLTTGGAFDLSILQSNTDTNFASVNPSIEDSLALTFTQPLLRGAGSTYNTSVQREYQLRMHQQDERLRQARQDLRQRVANTYWELVAAQKQLQVAEETLALGREQLEQNRRRLTAGVGTEVEVLQADANVAQRVEQRLLRLVVLKNSADRLKGLMYPGTDEASWELELEPVTPLPNSEDVSAPEWRAAVATAVAQRSELKQQLLEIDAGEQQLVRAVSERKAALDFVLSTRSNSLEGSEAQAFDSAISWDFPTNMASLAYSLPIGNRSALAAEKSARAAVRSARLAYDQLESQIFEEVRIAVRNTQYTIEAVRAAAVSSELSRRQLAAEQARYREGLSTNFQVLEYQQQLAESLYTETLANTNLAKALVQLQRAQGVLGDPEP